jgi:hypothetical protein
MVAKKLFNEVFEETNSVENLEKIVGGMSKRDCATLWAACQVHQVVPCGNNTTSACEAWKKYCK